jgi:hypothetical protein
VYLEGVDFESQGMVRDSLYTLLFERAQGLLGTDPKGVVRLGKLLLDYDPYNPDYLVLCLQALRSSNNYKGLMRLYDEAKERLLEVGKTLPETWQVYLNT